MPTRLKSGDGVFFSHASRDHRRVEPLRAMLRSLGITVFMDRHTLVAGANWVNGLAEGLHGCAQVFLFWSEAAAASQWVMSELKMSVRAGKTVVPLLLDTTPLPKLLEQVHGVALEPIFEPSLMTPSMDSSALIAVFEEKFGKLTDAQKEQVRKVHQPVGFFALQALLCGAVAHASEVVTATLGVGGTMAVLALGAAGAGGAAVWAVQPPGLALGVVERSDGSGAASPTEAVEGPDVGPSGVEVDPPEEAHTPEASPSCADAIGALATPCRDEVLRREQDLEGCKADLERCAEVGEDLRTQLDVALRRSEEAAAVLQEDLGDCKQDLRACKDKLDANGVSGGDGGADGARSDDLAPDPRYEAARVACPGLKATQDPEASEFTIDEMNQSLDDGAWRLVITPQGAVRLSARYTRSSFQALADNAGLACFGPKAIPSPGGGTEVVRVWCNLGVDGATDPARTADPSWWREVWSAARGPKVALVGHSAPMSMAPRCDG